MNDEYVNVVGITFKKYGKKYYFDCHNLKISVDKLTKIACQKKINVYVYRCSTNGGGSYGFYTGMKLAYEKLNTDLQTKIIMKIP